MILKYILKIIILNNLYYDGFFPNIRKNFIYNMYISYIIVFTHNFLMNIKYSLVLLFKILFSIMTLLTILKKIIEIKD